MSGLLGLCMGLTIMQYGGKYVVNPSGGLEAKGHPLGATGLGMHFYISCEPSGAILGSTD